MFLGKKGRQLIENHVNQQTDEFANRYADIDDPTQAWFGGLDLDSKNDYAHQYMSPEQIASWGSMTPDQRKEILRATVGSAMRDDDDAVGETLVKRGVPLAIAAVGGYALAPHLAGLAGAGGGGAAGLAGRAGALGVRSFLPGESGGIPDVMGGGGGGLGGLMPQGIGDWIKLGTTAAGALGALGGASSQPGGPPPTTPGTVMPPQTLRRTQNPMAAPSYFTYGKQGGEHRFFTDASYSDGTATPPASTGAPGAGALPTSYVPPNVMAKRGVLGRAGGGGVSGPGTGRSDSIEALLSDGEYVIDAESVALLGDGSVDAGAARLDELRTNLRKHKGAALAKGKFTPAAKDPAAYMGKAKGGILDVPVQNKQRLVQLLEKREPNFKAMTDEELRQYHAWLESIRNQQPPPQRAKGGRVHYPFHPSLRAEDLPPEIKLDRLERFMEQYKRASERANPPKPKQEGYDPYNRGAKKAKGGAINLKDSQKRLGELKALDLATPVLKKAKGGAVKDLDKLGDRLELALKLGDAPEIRGSMLVPPSLLPQGELK